MGFPERESKSTFDFIALTYGLRLSATKIRAFLMLFL